MPTVVVVGGPNGSGKTSLTSYLVKKGRIKTAIINPDDIALKEFGNYSFHVKAARVALNKREEARIKNADFAFETTFSGNSEINEIIACKKAGYQTVLYYVSLKSILDNLIRVEERQANNGHRVNQADIRRRFEKSRVNLLKHVALFDIAYLFDNSGSKRSRVAIFKKGMLQWLNPKHKNHPFYASLFRI